MHLIPASWSHLHILVSVFPSCGLIFVLGFYVAGIITDNDGLKRTCLAILGILAILAVPTYLSGSGSMAALSGKDISKDMLNYHYYVGLVALASLVAVGVVAWYELWRSQSVKHLSAQGLNLILVLGLITVGLMIVADELGWEINHFELHLPPKEGPYMAPGTTPETWSHVHMILNHFPTVGFVFAIVFYLIALALNNDVMKRAGLVVFVICGILGVPTYVTGAASMWALTDPPIPQISKALINEHRDMALWTLFGLGFTGAAAWLELWRYRYFGRFSKLSLTLVMLFAVVTLGIMAETGHRGGQINHPEIHVATDILPTDPTAGITPAIESLISKMIWFVPWQIVHFFGYCLIFGTVFAVVLRVLGFWKSLSFASVHRLLLLGFLGVLMNVFSGMLMMLADSYRYVVGDVTFAPKIALIPIGAVAVLYFSVSDRLWNLKPGEDAPTVAKWVAVLVLLAWAGVIVCGRLLNYL